MEELTRNRTYFTLLDEDGIGHPAVEYVAATLDVQPAPEIMPLRRFVKLIGSGEHLEPLDNGRYIGSHSGRAYSTHLAALPTPLTGCDPSAPGDKTFSRSRRP